MAAAEAKRDVCYFTFDERQLRDELYEMHKYLTEKEFGICKWRGFGYKRWQQNRNRFWILYIISVFILAQLWDQISQYYQRVCSRPKKYWRSLFEFIMYSQNEADDTDTTDENNDDADRPSHERTDGVDSPNWGENTPWILGACFSICDMWIMLDFYWLDIFPCMWD